MAKNDFFGLFVSITIGLFLLSIGVLLFGFISNYLWQSILLTGVLLVAFVLTGAISFRKLLKRIRNRFI